MKPIKVLLNVKINAEEEEEAQISWFLVPNMFIYNQIKKYSSKVQYKYLKTVLEEMYLLSTTGKHAMS